MAIANDALVTISKPGWVNPRPVLMSGIVATWVINQAGTFSGLLPTSDALALGYTDLIGSWLYYEHSSGRIWSGVIQDEPSDLSGGTVEIAAATMHALLMTRVAPIIYSPLSGHAGALARRSITDVQTADPLPFRGISADETGPIIEIESRGTTIYDTLTDLAGQSGQEYDITVDRARNIDFQWVVRLGEDKTDRVLLAEGYQIVGGRIDRSLPSVTNDIIGVAANDDYARSSTVRLEASASLSRFGRQQSIRRYDGVVSASAIRAKVRNDLMTERDGVYLPTITVPSSHPIVADIQLGDTVRYWSQGKNRELDYTVKSITVRDTGTVELAGVATEVRVPQISAGFRPDLLSGLLAWYDAADASTIELYAGVNREVQTWNDKSGNDLHLWTLFPLVNLTPTYEPYTLNGRSAIRMGANRQMRSPSIDLSSTTGLTIFVVAKRSGTSDSVVGIEGNLQRHYLGVAGSDQITGTLEGNVGTSSYRHANAWGASVFHVVSMISDTTLGADEVTVFDNGVSNGMRPDNANNTGGFGATSVIFVGYSANSFDVWDGDIAEIVIYQRALPADQRMAVESYLRRKWGLA